MATTLSSKITPCLWCDGNAEEAVSFYTGIFKNSRILGTAYYGESGQDQHGQKPGRVMMISFELEGQSYVALNGGPNFKFNEAISFQIFCDTQEELDYYWDKLNDGGDPDSQVCGWLKDRFGMSWQVVPSFIPDLLTTSDQAKCDRVMAEVMNMTKLDIATLLKAADA